MEKRRALFWATTALSLVLGAPSARAEGDQREEIVELLASQSSRADLIVLLDTSGSMAKHFEAARRFVGDLAEIAGPEDTVTFMTFSSRAMELMPPVAVRGGGAAELRARLEKIEMPRGRHTDLGAGLEAVLDALLRPGYAPLSMVFLITDFCSEPSPKSAYAGEFEGKGPCRRVLLTEALKKKTERIFGAGDQSVRSFALALEPVSEAGLGAAREALGSLVRVDVSKGDLSQALENVRLRLEYDRAALAIERMLKHPPLVLEAPREPLPFFGSEETELALSWTAPVGATIRVRGLRTYDARSRLGLVQAANTFDIPEAPLRTSTRAGSLAVRFDQAERPPRPGEARNVESLALTRDVEVELGVEIELSPRGSIQKLLGAEPRSKAVVRQRLALALAAPELPDPPIAFSAPMESETILLEPGRTTPVGWVLGNRARWAELEVACTLGGTTLAPVRLAPSSSVTLSLDTKNDAAWSRLRLERERTRALRVDGGCEVVAVAKDGTRLPRGRVPVAASIVATWREGIPASWALGLLLLGIAGTTVYLREIRPRGRPAALVGRLVLLEGPGEFRRVSIALRGRTHLTLEGSPKSDAEVRLDGDRIVLPGVEGTVAELYAEKVGRGNVMRLRRIGEEAIQVGTSALGAEPVVLRRGRARFTLGAYRCRIE